MLTILVSGASGVVGYGTLKSLRQSSERFLLIGTSIYADSVAPAFCDIFELAPLTSDQSYIEWLCGIIAKYNVDMIIPGIDADMYKWNENRSMLETKTAVLLNNESLIGLCKDKWVFFGELSKHGSLLAIDTRADGNFLTLKKELGLPFLLKPKNGFASKGIVKVHSEEDFEPVKETFGSVLIAQPIIGTDEEEFTASAFFDKNSVLCCFMTLKRKLSKEGFTDRAQSVELPGVKKAIEELAQFFKPIGPTNFQFRKVGDSLKLLEINPRISSSTSIRSAFGYNESLMSVNYFILNNLPAQPAIKSGFAVRYIEEHIFI